MRRLLLSLMALWLGALIGCRNHTMGVCDCVDRHHGSIQHDSHKSSELHQEMPKGK